MPVTRENVADAARLLRGRVRRTPLIETHAFRRAGARPVWLKLESLQHTRSFKYRGALNAVLRHREQNAALPPLVTASAGNHGLALATAAAAAGVPVHVCAPATTPAAKLDGMRRSGVTIDTSSRDYDAAEALALTCAATHQWTYVSPYSHPDVIAGAGTVGLEILEDLPDAAAIVVPTGGGGLLSGIALAAGHAISVIGVEPEVNPVFTRSLAAGRIQAIAPGDSLADGLLGNLESESATFDLVREHAAGVRTVTEADIVRGVRALFDGERLVSEGAGAIGIGALLAGQLDDLPDPLVLVVSGANVDASTFVRVVSG